MIIDVIGLSVIASIILGQLLDVRRERLLLASGEVDLEFATRTFAGTTGGGNVTRLVALGMPGLANDFFAKAVADVPIVLVTSLEAGKWDYYRTDWRRVSKRRL